MATFKAEFLSHYYEGRVRPVTAYSMGLIYWWSRAAAAAPQVANAMMSLPLVKRLAGVAPERRMPVYARETFVEQFRRGRLSPGAFGATLSPLAGRGKGAERQGE